MAEEDNTEKNLQKIEKELEEKIREELNEGLKEEKKELEKREEKLEEEVNDKVKNEVKDEVKNKNEEKKEEKEEQKRITEEMKERAREAALKGAGTAGAVTGFASGLIGKGYEAGKKHLPSLMYLLIVIILIIFNYMEVSYFLPISTSVKVILTRLLIHLIIALILYFLLERDSLKKGLFSENIKPYLIFAIIAVAITLIDILGVKYLQQINPKLQLLSKIYVLLRYLFPPWVLFLSMRFSEESKLLRFIRAALLIILSTLLIITAFTQLTTIKSNAEIPVNINPGDFSLKESAQTVGAYIKESVNTIKERITGAGKFAITQFKRSLDDSLGRRYTSKVDPYQKEELGVKFTEIWTNQPKFREQDPVILWATIKATRYLEPINLTLSCSAKGMGKEIPGIIKGLPNENPNNLEISSANYIKNVQCYFEPDSLTKGSYTVTFYGTFDFQTYAYIPYYFSPLSLINAITEEGKKPSEVLGIKEKTISVTTKGPVKLGLSSDPIQPIPLSPENPDLYLPAFGASIENAWINEGKIATVQSLELIISDEFELTDCDRETITNNQKGQEGQEGEKTYTFKIENPGEYFSSVTCALKIKGNNQNEKKETVNKMLNNFDLITRTFVARAIYKYEISKAKTVVVT